MSYIQRADWGAKPPKHVDPLPWAKIDAIALHYTGSFSDLQPDYSARVRAVQNYHMISNGWADIAYNYLVSQKGDKFIGRGPEVMSAATYHHNDHTVAVCFLGADKIGRDDVTDAGRRAISEIFFDIEARSGKKLGRLNVIHEVPGRLAISGHKIFVNTECPGLELMGFISTRGWEAYRQNESYPKHFFKWAAWWLGEGDYKEFGPRNRKVRPKYPLMPVTLLYWLALRRFINARNKDKDAG